MALGQDEFYWRCAGVDAFKQDSVFRSASPREESDSLDGGIIHSSLDVAVWSSGAFANSSTRWVLRSKRRTTHEGEYSARSSWSDLRSQRQ